MSSNVLILGGTGYIGQAFVRELARRKVTARVVRRAEGDYTRFDELLALLRSTKSAFLVNCAGYTGKPNVDACEEHRAETLLGNALLPHTIAHACAMASVPWGHVSSGCIFSGAKIAQGGAVRTERDLLKPELRQLVDKSPEAIQGFAESDEPNFSFRQPPCSFYSGTKALGEEALAGAANCYIWRLRIPFDEFNNERNYLSKVQRYPKVYDNVNSLSHRGDFARACLDLWSKQAPFGTYNVTNPGYITTREVISMIERKLKPGRQFEFWKDDDEFYRVAAKTPRSNCVLDVSKLLAAGVTMRPVREALEAALCNWQD